MIGLSSMDIYFLQSASVDFDVMVADEALEDTVISARCGRRPIDEDARRVIFVVAHATETNLSVN